MAGGSGGVGGSVVCRAGVGFPFEKAMIGKHKAGPHIGICDRHQIFLISWLSLVHKTHSTCQGRQYPWGEGVVWEVCSDPIKQSMARF